MHPEDAHVLNAVLLNKVAVAGLIELPADYFEVALGALLAPADEHRLGHAQGGGHDDVTVVEGQVLLVELEVVGDHHVLASPLVLARPLEQIAQPVQLVADDPVL